MRFIFLHILICLSSTCFAQASQPAANAQSIIGAGNARFTILTPQLIRMEWSREKIFTDEASQVFINRNLPKPLFEKELTSDQLIIRTGKLILEYKITADSFSNANLKITSLNSSPAFEWRPGTHDPLNLKGTTRTLDGKDGGDASMLEQGILSRSGWALINDSRSYVFDNTNWIADRKDTSAQDWYFFGYGIDYKKALHDFTKVAGKIPMPPRFAFGYWWSRYWIYGENEMKDLVNTFKELDIPIDVMIIDMDWHETYGFRGNATRDDGQGSIVGWTGYTWNKNIFPEPKKFLDWMEARHIKNALNLHPSAGIPPMEEKYNAFAKAYNFDTSGKKYIPYYGSDKKWASIYFDSVLRPLEKMGVDFWWLDWQQYPYDRKKNKLSNTWWLNHIFFTDMQKSGKRPLLFHRWGGLGNHRYQVGFSGDTYTTWKTLAFQPEFTSTAANVGYGYWSHDIGGHQISASNVADIKDGELFLRWMQFGVFSPVLRTHSTKKAEIDRRFWNFKDEYRDIVSLVKLRYQLNPYIYTASRMAYDSGISLVHPLYYQANTDEAYNNKSSYFFGNQMIVAPVTQKTDTSTFLVKQKMWLPEGEWEEWFTGTRLSGNREHERSYAKTEIPLFVKAGSIIPLYPSNIKNLQHLSDTVILQVFDGSGSGSLYEDDGETDRYRRDEYTVTNFTQRKLSGNVSVIEISPARGTYKGMKKKRNWIVKLHKGLPPHSVIVNGQMYPFSPGTLPGTWTYTGDLEAIISLPSSPLDKKTIINLKYEEVSQADKKLLEGYNGFTKRMPFAMERIKFEISAVDWGAAIPDLILRVESLPVRIQYDPKNTLALLRENGEEIKLLRQTIMAIPDVNKGKLKSICDFLQIP